MRINFFSRSHRNAVTGVLLSALLVTSLAACGNNTEATPTDDPPAPTQDAKRAEELKSAPAVAADSPELKEFNDLNTSYYQDTLGKIQPKPSKNTGGENNNGEDGGEGGAENGSGQQPNSEQKAPEQILDEGTQNSINNIATDSAADEFSSNAVELANNGQHMEGSPTIVGSPKVTQSTYKDQPARLMEVCLDNSNVKVKNQDGSEVPPDNTPQRSLNIYTLVQQDGKWKIASHDYPDDPTC